MTNPNIFERSALNNGCVPGIAMVNDDVSEDGRPRLFIQLQDTVEDQTFVYVLQFLYTGKIIFNALGPSEFMPT